MASGNGVRINKPAGATAESIRVALELLADLEVLVGFPEDSTERNDEESKDLTNAALGYIHDNGAPEANIPARPFMIPGIQEVETEVADLLGKAARAVVHGGDAQTVQNGLTQVGFKAMNSIKRKINEGIPPPLAEATLRQRTRGGRKNGGGARKGALQELDRRWDGQAPSTEFAKPLVDTAQMRNAVNYVIRSRKARKR